MELKRENLAVSQDFTGMIFLTEYLWFPDIAEADEEGLVAVGGDLSSERLMLAYQSGIFPWFIEQGLVLWFSPPERFVLFPVGSFRKMVLSNTG